MIKELEQGWWDVQSVLERPPQGLLNIYTSILCQVKKMTELVDKIHHTLQLVLAATRPLHLEELALGLVIMEGLRSHKDYNLVGDPTAEGRAIILSSQLLLMITLDKTMKVAHSSLRDYFFDSSTQLDMPAFHFQDSGIQCMMAKVVLSYLSFECFTDELSNEE